MFAIENLLKFEYIYVCLAHFKYTECEIVLVGILNKSGVFSHPFECSISWSFF